LVYAAAIQRYASLTLLFAALDDRKNKEAYDHPRHGIDYDCHGSYRLVEE